MNMGASSSGQLCYVPGRSGSNDSD
jgi:hypothetical protein